MKRLLKIVYVMILFATMVSIFLFSSQTSSESAILSSSFKEIAIKIDCLERLFYLFPYRKVAHFVIYFVLGIASIYTCKIFEIKYCGIISTLFCFLYACSDEIHQLFVLGRGASAKDVVIDTLGSLMAILLVEFVTLLYQKLNFK